MHGWQQSQLASASGIAAPTLSAQLNGTRVIRDDHLAAYITALDKYEQSQLVAAWLQDTLPAAALENVLDSTTNSLREEVRTWSPALSAEQHSMLHFWSEKLAADPELADIFRSLTRKAGWNPLDHSPTASTVAGHLAAAARQYDAEHRLPPPTEKAVPRTAPESQPQTFPAPAR